MSIKNFAGMTCKDFANLVKNNIDTKALFDAYINQHQSEIKWTNSIMKMYEYENHKIPFGFKDNIYIKGEITTSGSRFLQNFHAPFDSTVYELSKKNNLNVMCKANMDEFAMGSHNSYSAYGYVQNPINIKDNIFNLKNLPSKENIISPGGSSGGSAVIVNMGVCLGSFGTDTGGSVRGPAEWNGLCAIKPTFGNISRYGVVELSSSLDTVSIFAKTIECLKYFTNIFFSEDNKDAVNQVKLVNKPLNKKIASWKNLAKNIITPNAYKAMEDVENVLQKQGYIVNEVSINLDIIESIDMLYSIICYSDAASSLRVYNSQFYNIEESKSDNLLTQMYIESRSAGYGIQQVMRRMLIGSILTQANYSLYINKVWRIVSLLYNEFKQIFNTYDAIISPINGNCPRLYNLQSSGVNGALTSDIWLCSANLCGLPAVALSTHIINEDICGIQLIGDIGHDYQLLTIAQDIDSHYQFNEKIRGKFEYIHDNKMTFTGDK